MSNFLRRRIITWGLYLPVSGELWRELLTLYENDPLRGYPVRLVGMGLQDIDGKHYLTSNRTKNITANNAEDLKTEIDKFFEEQTTKNLIAAWFREAKQ